MFVRCLWMQDLRSALLVVIRPRHCGQIRHPPVILLPWLSLVAVQAGWAQAPQIAAEGVVNAASYEQPIVPGSIVSIFGANLAATTATAKQIPLPTILAGTSVTMNGLNASLFYVSPAQINLQAPWELQAPELFGTVFRSVTVVVTTPSGSSGAVQAPIYHTSPGIFSLDGSGCGRAAALNVAPDGGVSLNSSSNSAAPGDYISVYGTGFDLVYFPPPDGMPALGPQSLITAGGIAIDGIPLIADSYDGLAPGLVGVEQINFQIPPGTREGCAVPITAGGLTLSISIHPGRGQCVDPPIQSYGQVMLIRTVATGIANERETDTLTAIFPSGPALRPPPTPAQLFGSISYPPLPVARTCPVPGYADLSAGTLQVQAINANEFATAQPTKQVQGVVYKQTLPAGFIAPGPYNISAAGGPVTFRAGLNIDSPIQIQTPFPPGTVIPSSQPLTVKWTGGVPGDVVKVSATSGRGFNRGTVYAYVDASAGSYTLSGSCNGYPTYSCSLGVGSDDNAEVSVELSPESPVSVHAQGVTRNVLVYWTYRFVFGGLVFGP